MGRIWGNKIENLTGYKRGRGGEAAGWKQKSHQNWSISEALMSDVVRTFSKPRKDEVFRLQSFLLHSKCPLRPRLTVSRFPNTENKRNIKIYHGWVATEG